VEGTTPCRLTCVVGLGTRGPRPSRRAVSSPAYRQLRFCPPAGAARHFRSGSVIPPARVAAPGGRCTPHGIPRITHSYEDVGLLPLLRHLRRSLCSSFPS
jgi:hypothetical protein